MRLTIVLFDGFTALDVVGGYEVLANVPGMEVAFAAHASGIVAADSGSLGMAAGVAFPDIEDTDIVYVPGGPGVQAAIADGGLVACVARLSRSAQWTFGVCNGVEILGAAGLLDGRTVTTNFFARAAVAAYGATVVAERYVRDGKLVTGAGVSSSIDAALYLASLIAGEQLARIIQLGIEYYPDPPLGSGTPESQPQPMRAVIAAVERAAPERLAARRIPFAHIGTARKSQ